jgi:hypothetical protein
MYRSAQEPSTVGIVTPPTSPVRRSSAAAPVTPALVSPGSPLGGGGAAGGLPLSPLQRALLSSPHGSPNPRIALPLEVSPHDAPRARPLRYQRLFEIVPLVVAAPPAPLPAAAAEPGTEHEPLAAATSPLQRGRHHLAWSAKIHGLHVKDVTPGVCRNLRR